jgi:hypothetical protein
MREGAELVFEVLEADGGLLQDYSGTYQSLYFGEGTSVFWAKIGALELVQSTHPVLACLKDTPTLRGKLTVVSLSPDHET